MIYHPFRINIYSFFFFFFSFLSFKIKYATAIFFMIIPRFFKKVYITLKKSIYSDMTDVYMIRYIFFLCMMTQFVPNIHFLSVLRVRCSWNILDIWRIWVCLSYIDPNHSVICNRNSFLTTWKNTTTVQPEWCLFSFTSGFLRCLPFLLFHDGESYGRRNIFFFLSN